MKRKLLIILTAGAALSCAVGLTACNLGGEPEEKTVTVTYHLNGGDTSAGQYYDVNEDGTVEKFNYYDAGDELYHVRVERETWLFGGWYTDAELTTEFVNGQAEYPESMDLYAKWTDKITVAAENFKDYFTVSSRWNGGMNVGNAAINFSFAPKSEYIIDPKRSTGSVEISANTKLGTFAGPNYEITLNSDNEFTYSGRTVVTTEAEFQLGAPTINYEIKSASAELYLLHKDPIAVTLNTDGGTVETPVISVAGGDTLKNADLPTPVKEGYRFKGWYLDAEFKTEFNSKIITRETTVYAKWHEEVTFTFDSKGGSAVQPATFFKGEGIYFNGKYKFGDDPVREGYAFSGWYTDDECAEAFTERSAKESITLYAKWEPYRTVNFDCHGGSEKQSLTVLNKTVLTKKELGEEPTKSGLVFKGWYQDAEYKNKYGGEPVVQDTTLHALWCYEFGGLKEEGKLEELLPVFFDYGVTYEKTQETQDWNVVDEIVVHISVSLKEQFRGLDFAVSFSVYCDFFDAEGTTNLKRLVETVQIDAQNYRPSVEFDSVIYKIDMQYTYDRVESMQVSYSCNWSRIYLPEGYELPANPQV